MSFEKGKRYLVYKNEVCDDNGRWFELGAAKEKTGGHFYFSFLEGEYYFVV